MTSEERVQVVAKLGFTERQARFLVTVMRHSGVWMPRQDRAFAGIVHGQKTRKFFEKLERLAGRHELRSARTTGVHLSPCKHKVL